LILGKFLSLGFEGGINKLLWQLILVNNTSSMGVFSSIGDRCFWKLILWHKVVCGQLFHTKHLVVQHCVGESYFLQLIGGGVATPSTNEEDLNSCCYSCAGINKMEIYVT
jgi:hypothetical protein